MNPLYAAYCRTFQTVLRLALPILPYRDPVTLQSVDEAVRMLAEKGKRRPLIVTDRSLHELGLLNDLFAALEKNQLDFVLFDETVPNPTVSNVEDARALYLRRGCDCIVAFGGGSAMDCAKACGARIARPNKPISRMEGILGVLLPTPLLVAVPTTAGTGSETTLAAVITDDQTHHKYPISDFPLIPRYAVLDYRVTLGLPKHITSTTGIDALVHAVETYIGRSTTKQTRACAEQAVTLISRYLKRAYDDPTDMEARKNMLLAANRAGLAFSKSYVGYVHGVAHSLGGQYGTPHGLANAVICPYVLELYGSSCHAKLGQLARATGIAEQGQSDAAASATFIQWFRDLNASLDIPTKLSGIKDEHIPQMARYAAAESNPLYPVPKLMDAQELEQIYHLIKE
ncbi:MAG: iron-containing alcohol dehydrogenase [Coriobacteriia bacterium]|nr:iron-containing alcohol dehydrogenase [Coriobacteriia bacterium]